MKFLTENYNIITIQIIVAVLGIVTGFITGMVAEVINEKIEEKRKGEIATVTKPFSHH